MKTYLLQAKKPETLARLEEKITGYWLRRRCRAVLVTEKRPPKRYIVEERDGSQLAWAKPWVNRSLLAELHDEYLRHAPVRIQSKEAAIRAWLKARADLVAAEKAVKQAKEDEYAAAERIVLTHGKGPVVIEGTTYDSSYTLGRKPGALDRVFLIPRRYGGLSEHG